MASKVSQGRRRSGQIVRRLGQRRVKWPPAIPLVNNLPYRQAPVMAERRNFLLLAMGMGAFGILLGAITIWDAVSGLGP